VLEFRAFALATVFAAIALCQDPQPESSSQIRKEFAIGHTVAVDLEKKDGKLEDAALDAYFNRVLARVAKASGTKQPEIRITRSLKEYAQLLPGTLYLSGAMLERIANEGELAGLFAHELAHGSGLATRQNPGATIPSVTPACVLASPALVLQGSTYRDAEIHATAVAVDNLKRAGYDPQAMLDLLSKLAYEHPAWSKAMVPDDLLNVRATLEQEAEPASGYEIDSSEFISQHTRLVGLLGHAKKTPQLQPKLR
jgi:predicted Zn-dependent protease